MDSLAPFPRHAFWMGWFVTVAFRIFAYGVLWATAGILTSRSFPFANASLFYAAYGLAVLASPFAVPLIAGFLGAFHWQHFAPRDYVRPVFVGSALMVLGLCVVPGSPLFLLTGYPLAPEVILFLLLYCCLDAALCVSGATWGSEFWGGRAGRQLFGDFSTIERDV